MNRKTITSSIICSLLLTACGGSGGSDTSQAGTTNVAPTISIPSITGIEGTLISIPATVSDNDMTGLSYAWTVSSLEGMDLITVDEPTLVLESPFINQDSVDLSISLTVSDSQGLSSTKSAVLTIDNDAPVITFSNDLTGIEKQVLTITPTVTSTPEPTIEWSFAGIDELEYSTDGANVTLNIPALIEPTLLAATLTVTDSDNDTTSLTTEITIDNIASESTVLAKFTHEAFFNSPVIIKNGLGTFETTSDGNGRVETTIWLDDDLTDYLVTIEANGTDEYEHISHIALLDSSEDTNEQNTITVIDEISTAELFLLKQNTIDGPLEKKVQISHLLQFIDVAYKHKLAALLSLIAENEIQIPSEFDDLYSWLEDKPAVIDTIVATDEDVIQEAITKTVAKHATEAVTIFNIVDKIYPLPGYGLDVFSFDDNQGTHGNSVFEWSIEGSLIQGTYSYAAPVTSSELVYAPNYSSDTRINTQFTANSFEMLVTNETEEFVEIALTQYGHKEYVDKENMFSAGIIDPSGSHESLIYFKARKSTSQKDMPQISGKTVSLPIADHTSINIDENIDLSVYEDVFTFNSDGSGTTAYTQSSFTWSKTTDALTITYTSGKLAPDEVTYTLLENKTDTLWDFAIDYTESDEGDRLGKGSIHADTPKVFVAEDVPGLYAYTRFEEYTSYFWYELHEDGRVDAYSVDDNDENGIIEEDEYFSTHGAWSLEDGKIKITRIRN